jgi:hypothetical protein
MRLLCQRSNSTSDGRVEQQIRAFLSEGHMLAGRCKATINAAAVAVVSISQWLGGIDALIVRGAAIKAFADYRL